MADYGFIARPQEQNAFRQIGDVVNMARGATALQQERATLEADIARKIAESQRSQTEAGVAAQTAAPRVAQQAAQTQTAQTEAVSSRWALDSSQAAKGYEIAGGLAQDPRIVKGDPVGSVDALMSAEDQMRSHKIPEANIRVLMAPLYGIAGKNPAGLRQALDNIIRSGSGAGTQAAVINTPVSVVNTGAELRPIQTQPGAQGGMQPGSPSLPLSLPLGERENVGANPVTGNPQTTIKNAQGNVTGVQPTPTAPSVPVLNPGDREAIPQLTTLRQSINAQAARVPESKFNNEQIIKLADNTNLGQGSQVIANLRGQYAALPWTNDSASNYNVLGHFIARETANMAQAMGANTDTARGLAQDATVSTGWTASAVKSAAKVNNALVTGLENFNRGMEKAVAAANGNVLAVRDFQNKWSQAFDPNVYRYANALESGDKAEITKILGPEGSPQRKAKAAELARKSGALFRLSNEGR